MILFWIIIVILTLIAVGFVIYPLLFERKRLNKLLIVIFVIFVPLFTMSLYLKLGASALLKQSTLLAKNAPEIRAQIARLNTPDKVIQLLKARLRQMPNSAKGWYLLGKIYLDMGRFRESINAFAKAYQLNPKSTKVMILYAEALFFANHGRLTKQARQLVQRTLQLQPHNVNAINLLALDAYQQKNYRKAVRYWEKLIAYFPPDSPVGRKLLRMIAKTQKKMEKFNG